MDGDGEVSRDEVRKREFVRSLSETGVWRREEFPFVKGVFPGGAFGTFVDDGFAGGGDGGEGHFKGGEVDFGIGDGEDDLSGDEGSTGLLGVAVED